MVFAANGATVLDGIVLGARFRHRERRAEAAAHRAWFGAAGFQRVVRPRFVNEGEGDLLVAGRPTTGSCWPAPASAPTRGRTPRRPPCWAARCCRWSWSTRATTTSTPRWPCSTRDTVAWLPEAFSAPSRELLEARFPDAVVADPADAAVLGLNAVSDGRHVVLPAQAPRLAALLAERGFEPVPVDLSELLKGGGGVKCCTLEVRA